MEHEASIYAHSFLEAIKEYGDIYFCYNSHVEKFSHNSSNKKYIKVITFKELLGILAGFEDYTINYFYEQGLNKDTDPDYNITMITTNERNKVKLETHDFVYKDNKTDKAIHDVPYFHKDMPQGFSVFCTDEEQNLIKEYLKKKNNKKNKNKEKTIEEESITDEPEPSKTNFVCQLCKMRFNNYKEHLISELHKSNRKQQKNSYSRLANTFKRITNTNTNQKTVHSNCQENLKTLSTQFSSASTLLSSQQEINSQSCGINLNENLGYNLRNKKSSSCERISKNKLKNESDICLNPQQGSYIPTSNLFKNFSHLQLTNSDNIQLNSKKIGHKRKRNENCDNSKALKMK